MEVAEAEHVQWERDAAEEEEEREEVEELQMRRHRQSDVKFLPLEKAIEGPQIAQSSTVISVNGVDFEVVKEDDEELKDLGIERVLKEQNAYDLLCPNCNSCITRRVILRKRKRRLGDEPLGVGIPVGTDDDPGIKPTPPGDDPGIKPTPPGDENPQTEMEAFRCPACFTCVFYPGNGFDCRQIPSAIKNCLPFPFPSPDPVVIIVPVEPPTGEDEDRESRGVEVIKSIVYGGLIESITSLGVVSSAAGSDTAIINIVALGLANLFGGLFVICHNLWDLKNDDHGVVHSPVTENTPNQGTQQRDKYRDLLGQRENFLLHATVAILSYVIFGLLPPIIYGFSFRDSNDRNFKLIAVAAASLLCITVLAVAKAYVQRPPKAYIKTVFYHVSLGFMASGVSFVAGDLVEKLIEKLGWLSTGVDLSLPKIVESYGQPKWTFY